MGQALIALIAVGALAGIGYIVWELWFDCRDARVKQERRHKVWHDPDFE